MNKTTYAELEDLTEMCTAWQDLKWCTTCCVIDFSSSVGSHIPVGSKFCLVRQLVVHWVIKHA